MSIARQRVFYYGIKIVTDAVIFARFSRVIKGRDLPDNQWTREFKPSAWGYNRATLFLGDIIQGPGRPGWGSLKSETVK
jgi:hypothetical protein